MTLRASHPVPNPIPDSVFEHARTAFAAAGQTLQNVRRDFPEWHRGRPRYALWALDVDVAPVREAVAGAASHLDGLLLDNYRRQPHITLARRARISKASLPPLAFPRDDRACTATLYKSTLERTGAVYKPLHTARLGG